MSKGALGAESAIVISVSPHLEDSQEEVQLWRHCCIHPMATQRGYSHFPGAREKTSSTLPVK